MAKYQLSCLKRLSDLIIVLKLLGYTYKHFGKDIVFHALDDRLPSNIILTISKGNYINLTINHYSDSPNTIKEINDPLKQFTRPFYRIHSSSCPNIDIVKKQILTTIEKFQTNLS